MKKILLLVCLGLLFAGCAKDYYTTLDKKSDGKVGSLKVNLSKAMKNVNLTIDNELVAEGKFTDQVIVNNVPTGEHKLVITGSGNGRHDLKKKKTISIEPGNQNTQLIESPSRTVGSYILQFASTAVVVVYAVISLSNNSY